MSPGSEPRAWASRRFAAVALVLAATLALSVSTHAQSSTIQRIQYGTVVSAEPSIVKDQPRGTGAGAGSTIGAVAGYALADRGDRWLGAMLGGAVGGAAGHAVEKQTKKKKGWTLIIKLDSGEEIGIDVPGRKEKFEPGDRVRLMTGQQTKVTKVKD